MSQVGAIFFDDPWGFLLSDGSRPANTATLDGAGTPRSLTTLSSKPPRWIDGAGLSPKASLAFRWNGQDYQAWHVPCSNTAKEGKYDLDLRWTINGEEPNHIRQLGLLHRPPEDAEKHQPEALRQDSLINWMVHSFQELGHTEATEDDSDIRTMIRRTWKKAQAIWIEPKSCEPRMELIIKMAQDRHLIRALHAIGESPRRILIRVRESTPVGRVQEMDAACIRHYAKLPGNSPAQKAGPRQTLLAVQRRPSFDTLENKVAAWTMAALQKRAESWRRKQTKVALAGTRARNVAQLAKETQLLLNSENLCDIRYTSLIHPSSANYPLTMETRYKTTYKAYRELLRYQKIKDDAWTWRRPLWSETVGQLVNCCLLRLWPEAILSTPFYRKEADRGRWLAAQASAGPFKTPWGQAYLIDSHDLESSNQETVCRLLDVENTPLSSIGATGCDQALWWPEKSAILPIWATIWTDDTNTWQSSLPRAGQALVRYASQPNTALKHVGGLIITAHVQADRATMHSDHSSGKYIHGLRLPMSAGMLAPEDFSQVINLLGKSLIAATEVLLR
jgi:Domain of unknown function (DUF2357)